MSQIKYRTTTKDGVEVEVMGGWDPPLSHYYMSIFYRDPPVDEEGDEIECLYVFDEDAIFEKYVGKNVWEESEIEELFKHFDSVLEKHGIQKPDGFWDVVRRSKWKNGNFVQRMHLGQPSLGIGGTIPTVSKSIDPKDPVF